MTGCWRSPTCSVCRCSAGSASTGCAGGSRGWSSSRAGCSPRCPAPAGRCFIAHVGGGQIPVAGEPSPAGVEAAGPAVALPGVGLRAVRRRWRAAARSPTWPGCDRAPAAQPPPALRNGVPTCPRHGARLGDAGPRPRTEVLAVRIGGLVRAPVRAHRGPAGRGRAGARAGRRDHARPVAQRRGPALDQPQPRPASSCAVGEVS